MSFIASELWPGLWDDPIELWTAFPKWVNPSLTIDMQIYSLQIECIFTLGNKVILPVSQPSMQNWICSFQNSCSLLRNDSTFNLNINYKGIDYILCDVYHYVVNTTCTDWNWSSNNFVFFLHIKYVNNYQHLI